MTRCWKISPQYGTYEQSESDLSFIGGSPIVPHDLQLPTCILCGAKQSFFFQVAFPLGSKLENHCLAVFSCTSCADEDHLIPEMISSPLHGAEIPANFLVSYQTNFRFMVFESSKVVLRNDYDERVRYLPLVIEEVSEAINTSKIGGVPNWLLDDESPGKYEDLEMHFLLQIMQDLKFDLLDGAPRQVELNLAGNAVLSSNAFYELFIGNFIYLFVAKDDMDSPIYAITQI